MTYITLRKVCLLFSPDGDAWRPLARSITDMCEPGEVWAVLSFCAKRASDALLSTGMPQQIVGEPLELAYGLLLLGLKYVLIDERQVGLSDLCKSSGYAASTLRSMELTWLSLYNFS